MPIGIYPRKNFIVRFTEKYIRDSQPDCWNWIGGKSKNYGALTFNKKSYRAHRVSYQIFKGEIPEQMLVCHHCDNPACINPDHLFLGSWSDNMKDAWEKGRMTRNGKIKLTIKQIKEIKKLSDRHADIAKKYGVTRSRISQIKRKKYNFPEGF